MQKSNRVFFLYLIISAILWGATEWATECVQSENMKLSSPTTVAHHDQCLMLWYEFGRVAALFQSAILLGLLFFRKFRAQLNKIHRVLIVITAIVALFANSWLMMLIFMPHMS